MGEIAARSVNTDTVAPKDRLDFWITAVSQTYVDLDCSLPNGGRAIDGRIEATGLGVLGLSRITASPHYAIRTPAGISRCSDDYCLVSIQVSGSGFVCQDGRTAALSPGDFALYDSTRPYQLRSDENFMQYVLMLPGATLRRLVSDTSALTARPVNGRAGAGRLLITMIESIMNDAEMGAAAAVAVAKSVEYVMVAGLAEMVGSDVASAYSADERLDQIKKAMMLRLRDPDLTISGIAAQLHMSISSIHRAFAGESCTPSEWIWWHRLEGVRHDLVDPAHDRTTIGSLARSWGFADPAHFNRTFRSKYGCTPGQYRIRST